MDFMDNLQFDNIKAAIANLSELIKKFFEMIKNLVDSFKKTIVATKTPTDG
jgi:phage-related protein